MPNAKLESSKLKFLRRPWVWHKLWDTKCTQMYELKEDHERLNAKSPKGFLRKLKDVVPKRTECQVYTQRGQVINLMPKGHGSDMLGSVGYLKHLSKLINGAKDRS